MRIVDRWRVLTTDGRFLGVDDPASNIPTVDVDSLALSSTAECGIPPSPYVPEQIGSTVQLIRTFHIETGPPAFKST